MNIDAIVEDKLKLRLWDEILSNLDHSDSIEVKETSILLSVGRNDGSNLKWVMYIRDAEIPYMQVLSKLMELKGMAQNGISSQLGSDATGGVEGA